MLRTDTPFSSELMQVLVDGAAFESESQIGIWRVFYETINRTAKDIEYTILLCGEPKQPVPEGVRVLRSLHRRVVGKNDIPRRVQRKIDSIKLERRFADAIWHSTFYSRDPRKGCKSIVTVYDMIAERFFALGGDWAQHQRDAKCAAITCASKLLAISNATASDLLRFYPDLQGEVVVMPLGSEHIFSDRRFAAVEKTTQGVLFVGNRSGYKNYSTVIEALASDEWPVGMRLRVVGAPFTSMEKDLHRYYNVSSHIDHLGRLSDAELGEEYQRSVCFVFPSLAEGFGIPVLEAQANDCVALLSNTSIFREIAGDGAIFFDPRDHRSICDAVRQANDQEIRESVLSSARENLTRFSWDDAARAVADVYSSLSG